MADLKLSDLHVNYGSFVALKNVSLKVHRGELVVLLGTEQEKARCFGRSAG